MRVIFNIHSDKAARAAGWRAKAVTVNEKRNAVLKDTLKAVILTDGRNMYEYLTENGKIGRSWTLYVNGIQLPPGADLEDNVKDNVQMHLMLTPN